MALTDREINALKPSLQRYAKRVERGLFIDVTPSGVMSWIFKYTLNGKQDKLVIGRYPDLTLKKAREARDKLAAEVAEGKSPAEEKRKLREESVANAEVLTVKAFGQRYYDEQVAKNWKDPSGELRYLEKDLYPALGDRPLKDITALDVQSVVYPKRDGGHPSALLCTFSC